MELTNLVLGETLKDHWATRRNVARAGVDLFWYLTFPRSPRLAIANAAVTDALAGTELLAPVEPDWLHCTLAKARTIADNDADETLVLLSKPPAEPFTLSSLGIFDEGVIATGITPAWQTWMDRTLRRVAPRKAETEPRVWAHVSQCYAQGPVPVADLMTALRPVADQFDVIDAGRPHLSLVELQRLPAAYQWNVIIDRAL